MKVILKMEFDEILRDRCERDTHFAMGRSVLEQTSSEFFNHFMYQLKPHMHFWATGSGERNRGTGQLIANAAIGGGGDCCTIDRHGIARIISASAPRSAVAWFSLSLSIRHRAPPGRRRHAERADQV